MLERIQDHIIAVETYGHQRYDAHIDAKRRCERHYFAHNRRKYPTLQMRRLKLKKINQSLKKIYLKYQKMIKIQLDIIFIDNFFSHFNAICRFDYKTA